MKKVFIALMMLTSISIAHAKPPGWFNVPNTDTYIEQTATMNINNGFKTGGTVLAWTQELGYVKINFGCATYTGYSIVKDGNTIVRNTYNPEHQYWNIRQAFCP